MADSYGLSPLLVSDFSGGVTDYAVGCPLNKNQVMDNYVINESRDAITRPGAKPFENVQIFTSGTLSKIIDHNNTALYRAGNQVKNVLSSVASEILSPQSHSVFTSGSDTSKASFSYWNKHTLASTDAFAPVQKIYKDANSNWKVTSLGLPEITYPTAMALANDIKTKLNGHMASHTVHTVASDTTHTITSPDATDFPSLMVLTAELLTKYQLHQNDADLSAGRLYHGGKQVATHAMSSVVAPETLFGSYTALQEMKLKLNAHDADATAHGVASTFQVTATTPSITGTAGTKNYIYGAHWTYRYSAETAQFVERGTVELIEANLFNNPDANAITLNNLPVLSSGAGHNFDDANVVLSIYRTTDAGGTLFLVAEVPNGTTSYVDTMSDATLQNQVTAYTEGGVLDNDMPPPCKFVEVLNDVAAYAGVKEGSIVRGNRVRFSKVGQPYSAPGGFYLDFENDLTGFSSHDSSFIAMTSKKIWRLDGGYSSTGAGGYTKRDISQRIGCVSNDSIVKTQTGLYFASEDGFYFTDGSTARKISPDINETYKALSNKQDIQGCYHKDKNYVVWSVKKNSAGVANETLFVANLNYVTDKQGNPFTSWSGGLDPLNFSASALAYVDGSLLRGDYRGYVLKHDPTYYDDAYIDTSLAPTAWGTQTIHYTFTSSAINFGSADQRKWVSKIVLNASNETSISLDISSSNDRSGVFVALKPVVKKGAPEWGDPSVVWNVTDVRWNYFPVVSEWRHMPAATQPLRCSYKQVKLTNSYTDIDNSSFAGPCSVTPAGVVANVTLLSYLTNSWLSDAVNYYISFATDNYTKEYLIIKKSTGTLTVSDPSASLTNQASTAWKIRGYRKREVLNLLNYSLLYSVITMTQDTYKAGS